MWIIKVADLVTHLKVRIFEGENRCHNLVIVHVLSSLSNDLDLSLIIHRHNSCTYHLRHQLIAMRR